MNLIPVAVAATVVAIVPPLRRRAVPVAAAGTAAVLGTGAAALRAVTTVGVTAAEGALGVGRAALARPAQPDADG